VDYYLADVNDASKKMLAGLYLMLRGVPFIYQGQEIGMENTNLPTIRDVSDIASLHPTTSSFWSSRPPERHGIWSGRHPAAPDLPQRRDREDSYERVTGFMSCVSAPSSTICRIHGNLG
jgi:glycosidase